MVTAVMNLAEEAARIRVRLREAREQNKRKHLVEAKNLTRTIPGELIALARRNKLDLKAKPTDPQFKEDENAIAAAVEDYQEYGNGR
jgi:hypothetical protein